MTGPELARFGFRVILLRGKHPVSRGGGHFVTSDAREVEAHHGNVGLMAGPFVVLDFDYPESMTEMMAALGAIRPTVETGSGKFHCYFVRPDVELPRYFFWRDARAGEIVRRPTEYAVAPPSIHPKTGRPYRWLVDPREPFPSLPDRWREHLLTQSRVILGSPSPRAPVADDSWDGPPADDLIARALEQPGAKRRHYGIKFQCPGCRAEGHDKHQDNAAVFNDGRWGCAFDSDHSRAIAAVLGVTSPSPVEGFGAKLLRTFGLHL